MMHRIDKQKKHIQENKLNILGALIGTLIVKEDSNKQVQKENTDTYTK